MDNKYRVHEVAKDFKLKGKAVGSKKVTEILTKYAQAPSSHMAVLSDLELSIVFDYLTQNNQIADLQEVFSETYHEPKGGERRDSAPAGKKNDQKKGGQGDRNRSDRRGSDRGQGDRPQQGGSRPQGNRNDRNDRRGGERNNDRRGGDRQRQNQGGGRKTIVQPAVQNPTSRVPQKKVVNTRSSADVNLDRYDSHLDDLTPDRVERMQHGKQKISSKRDRQQRSGKQSAKRRQEEQAQKMRRLQQEAARKAPVKVQIPDEITVGELASRMKKTGAVVVKNLMKMGVMASMSDVIDYDTAALVAMELGCKVEREVVVTIEEKLIDTAEDKE